MAKKRTPKGRGEVERLPSGKFRAVLSRVAVVAGVKKRVRASKTFAKRKDAWDWLDAQGRAGPVATQTVGEWLTAWLAVQAGKASAKTHAGYAQVVACHIAPGLAPVRLRDLDALAVEAWLAGLKAAGGSDDLRQRAGGVLRNALNAAVRLGTLAANPMAGRVRLPAPERAEKKAMSAAQAAAVLAAADEFGVGYAVRVWLDAGLRPGEMFALEWGDFDLPAGAVTVRRAVDRTTNAVKTAKTPKSRRTIPLSPATAAAVRAAAPAGGGVFLPAPEGGRWWASNFAEHVGLPLFAAAGLKGLGFDRYSFRHTMASAMLSAGVPLLVVSRRLGHAKPSVTLDTYGHMLEGDAQRAADAMAAFLPPGPTTAPRPPDPPEPDPPQVH